MSSGPYYTYSYARPAPPAGRLSTSRKELTHIGIAFAVLTLDFTLILGTGGIVFGGTSGLFSLSPLFVGVGAAAALTGFVAHELAHKVSAQRHGYWAEFRMAPVWLLFSIITSFFGLLWAAPGATMIGGMGDRRDWGRTALAGPLANFGFGAVFYAGSVLAYSAGSGLSVWLLILAYLNGWFGTFNLIPFGPLDGHKVLNWNLGVWALALVGIGALAAVSYVALFVVGSPLLLR